MNTENLCLPCGLVDGIMLFNFIRKENEKESKTNLTTDMTGAQRELWFSILTNDVLIIHEAFFNF